MIGYIVEQELGNLLPFERPLATILTMVEVDPDDPAFADPTKFVGPIYDEATAKSARRREGLGRQAGRRPLAARRPVAPARSGSSSSGRCAGLLEHGAVVICAGGGGIPTMYARGEDRRLVGVEAVIDKDLASSLLARELEADLFVMATDVDGVYADWGTPDQRRLDRVTPEELDAMELPGRIDGPEGRRGRASSPRRPASGPRSARSNRSTDWSRARPARTSPRPTGAADATEGRLNDGAFGVHSEVGKLRQVIVHRPDLSLKRLTPDNHDELLFDDVLWVERAQWEHDQFVARMRERGVEVLYVQDLLGEALAASDDARRRLIELVASEYVVGPGLVEPVRERAVAASPPDELARHLIGGLTVARVRASTSAGSGSRRSSRPPSTTSRRSSCRRCRTRCSRATRRAGSTAASRSTRCTGRPAAARPTTWPRSTAPTRCSRTAASSSGTRRWATTTASTLEDFGLASLEGGDVEIIGRGTVAIGMSERTTGRMIEQIARALFEKGAAERVIAAVMTKDRAHMHLDTVFTLLDRDKATAYPKVVEGIRAISLRPGSKPGTLDVRQDKDFLSAVADALGRPEAPRRRDRRRRLPAGARAVGRRQQRRRARARRRRRLRAQHVHDLEDAGGRRRGRRRSRASSSARAAAAGTA